MAQLEIKNNKPISKKLLLAGLFFFVLLISSSIIYFFYPFASKERKEYFTGEYPILFKGSQSGNALVYDHTFYVPLDFLKELDDTIVYDEKSESVILTTSDKVVQMPTDSLTYFINQKPVQLKIMPLRAEDGQLYISLEPVIGFFPYQYKILKNSNAIMFQADGENQKTGIVKEDDIHAEKLRLRTGPGLEHPFTEQVKGGEMLYLESEKEDYYFARKENGVAGYIQKEFIGPGETIKITAAKSIPPKNLPELAGPIHLTWEAVYTKNPDTSKIPDMPGVNVVSPTWFHLENGEGAIKSLASVEYSKWAKTKGYHIWGLFTNSFDPDLTHEAFKDFETRQSMIRQLLHYSNMYSLQGINLDIENVNPEDGPLITQFVREAAPYFREAGLVLSLDMTFISNSGNWSKFYEREKLAQAVDYVAVMAYDEHWASSPVSGSVSSIPWVEENLISLLEIVPQEKLILGVPLYTRLWIETEKEDGTMEVTSESLSMEKAKQWISTNKAIVKYDQDSGQNYVEHYDQKQKTTYKIWLEDELSLRKRAELAVKYELAGIATWSRFFADSSAWTALKLGDDQAVTKK
jgi:spore germination protein YaaH